jgi:Dual specificity phosphatase, catalytic domain
MKSRKLALSIARGHTRCGPFTFASIYLGYMPYTDFHWITDRLAIGGFVDEPEELPFDAILSMETHASPGLRNLVKSGRIDYQWHSIIDGVSHETNDEIVRRFDLAARQIHDWLQDSKRVLVHCFAGASRSVTAVIWYFMQFEGHAWEDALALIKQHRVIANPNIRFEVPLRIASGEHLSEAWIAGKIDVYCQKMLADFDVEVDPHEIRETLEEQGTLALVHASRA